jgi:hypothetical protein
LSYLGLKCTPVPSDDVMCRFIKPEQGKWNTNLGLPLQRAFKQDDLSVWSKNKLRTQNAEPADLLIDNLAGHAQAYHRAQEYLDYAEQVAQEEGIECEVQVVWRPDKVDPPWYRWKDAHAQVEALEGPRDFPLEFRRRLAANAKCVVRPGG